MSTYTKNLNDIYFLNDKNIVQDLHGSANPDINAIPSLSLLQDSYEELSSYTDELSVSISNTVSAIVVDLKKNSHDLELSVNGLSSYVKDLALSTHNISNHITDLELSVNTLSNYVNELALSTSGISSYSRNLTLSVDGISSYIDKLELSVDGISVEVDKKFVKKAGDNIDNLTVDNNLFVNKDALLSGNIAVGDKIVINDNHSVIALGTNVVSNKDHSFTWNADTADTYSPNDVNSFNINPAKGAKGVYIGTTTLSDIIKNDVKVTYDSLSNQVNSTSSFIVANYALSADVPTKTSLLINDAGFLISNDFNGKYNSETKQIILSAGSKVIPIDATAFIKDGMLSSASLITTREPPYPEEEKGPWLKLVFNTDAGKDTIYIDLNNLVDIYTAGTTGISVDNYKISLDFDIVGKKENIDRNTNDINTLSTNIIPAVRTEIQNVSVDVVNIQDYVDQLSGNGTYKPGIIPTLSTSISVLQLDSINNIKMKGYMHDLDITPQYLSSLIKFYNIDVNDGVINGSLINVGFGPTLQISTEYVTIDGIHLNNNDNILIYRKTNEYTLPLTSIIPDDVVIYHTDISRSEYEVFKYYISNDLCVISSSISSTFERISCELSTELFNLELSVNGISVIINDLCTQLSDAHNFLSSALSSEIKKLSTALSTNINTISANLSSEIKKLSTALSTNIVDLSTDLSNAHNFLSSALSSEIKKLSTALSTNIVDLSTDLSNAIHNKIFVKDDSNAENDYIDTLSVIKIERSDYEKQVVDGTILSQDCIYIISSDYIDAYEQDIRSLSTPGIIGTSNAANTLYVDRISTELSNEISSTKYQISTDTYIKKLLDDVTPEDGIDNIELSCAILALINLVKILSRR